jgi:hypothetical protein
MKKLVARDGIFPAAQIGTCRMATSMIDQSMPIVAETEQIAERRNSPLNSRAQISDGSGRRFFIVCRKNCARNSTCYDHLK